MKQKYYILILLAIFSFGVANAQTAEVWQTELGSAIRWQQVTPLGNYIVGTDHALAGLHPDDGRTLWSLPRFGGLNLDQVQQAGSSPFLSITKNGVVSLIDPFSGKEKFNSGEAGIQEINSNSFLYKSNGILISGKSSGAEESMVMADMATGKINWKLNEKFGRIVAVNELANSEILIVTLFNNYKINSKTGAIIWKNSSSKEADQLANLGAFGSLLKNVAEQQTQNMEFNVKFFKHPTKDIFIVGSEQENKNSMSSGSTVVSFKNVYLAYNLNDGSRIWNDALEMNGKLGELAFYGEGIIILPDNGGSTKINYFDLNSKQGKWGKKGRGIRVKGGIYDYIETDKGMLLISHNQDKNFLNFLDTNSGLLTFEKPVKISGEVLSTASLDKGILYTTTNEVNILNIQTGATLFPKSIPTAPGLIAEKDGQLFLFDLKQNVVKAVDMTLASVKNVSNIAIKFQGKETPRYMELRDGGILITSSQNLGMIGYDGKLIAQNYFVAPREPGIIRALRYAQAIRAGYIGAVSYAASAQLQAAAPKVREEDAAVDAVVQGFGEVYGQLGDAATDFAKRSFQQASARFKATADGRDFIIVLAKSDKGNALLKVNKDTCKKVGEISLGKEREPDYAVDDVTSQVFLKTSNSVVSSYRF